MLRQLARYAVLVLTLCAWVGANIAAPLHEITVVHELCEHGLVVELDDASHGDSDASDADPDSDEHRHGCAFDGVLQEARLPAPPVLVAPIPATLQAPHVQLVASLIVARGPPLLSYAPKTSPPRHG